MTKKDDISVDIAVIKNELISMKEDVAKINIKLDSNYATKEWVTAEYGNTRKMVYGVASVILLAVITALVALVVRQA